MSDSCERHSRASCRSFGSIFCRISSSGASTTAGTICIGMFPERLEPATVPRRQQQNFRRRGTRSAAGCRGCAALESCSRSFPKGRGYPGPPRLAKLAVVPVAVMSVRSRIGGAPRSRSWRISRSLVRIEDSGADRSALRKNRCHGLGSSPLNEARHPVLGRIAVF